MIRQRSILTNPRYTLFKCSNIEGCKKESQILNRKNLDLMKKEQVMAKLNEKYYNKTVQMLQHFFKLLNMSAIKEATEY